VAQVGAPHIGTTDLHAVEQVVQPGEHVHHRDALPLRADVGPPARGAQIDGEPCLSGRGARVVVGLLEQDSIDLPVVALFVGEASEHCVSGGHLLPPAAMCLVRVFS